MKWGRRKQRMERKQTSYTVPLKSTNTWCSVLASLYGKQNQKLRTKGKEMVNFAIPPHSSTGVLRKGSCLHGGIFLILRQQKKIKWGEFNSNLHVVQIHKVTHVSRFDCNPLEKGTGVFCWNGCILSNEGEKQEWNYCESGWRKGKAREVQNCVCNTIFLTIFALSNTATPGQPRFGPLVWKALWSWNILCKC